VQKGITGKKLISCRYEKSKRPAEGGCGGKMIMIKTMVLLVMVITRQHKVTQDNTNKSKET
jgi:hypothetical protein